MKKLLMYVNSMNAFGGIERVVSNLSSRLSEYYDVTILVKDEPISVYDINDSVRIETLMTELKQNMSSRFQRIFSLMLNMIRSVIALKKYLASHSYDFVYTAFVVNGFEVYFANKFYRKKIIASEHASYYAYNRVYKLLKKWLYPRLVGISVPTLTDTEIYKSLGYQAFYIPHIATFKSVTEANTLNSKRIINVGRLTSDKQQSLLLDIWKLVNDRYPENDWTLQIIGSGEEEDRIRKKIQLLGLYNIEMIAHTPKLDDYYKNAELFVFTSRMEGFGMVLLEAMAFGIPCISFDCPSGISDIIKHGNNGFLINCYDINEFADYICKYIEMDNENKLKMSNAAMETVQKWDNDLIIENWLKLFRKCQ